MWVSGPALVCCQALDGKGFYIDTPHIFAKIRKQLTLLVF
jgi:hypothetical protein